MSKLLLSFVVVCMLLTAGQVQATLNGHWTLDEGSGTTAGDSSGNSNNGTVSGGAVWTAGQVGGALNLNGSDSSVGVLNSTSLSFNTGVGLTVAFWANLNGVPAGTKALVTKGSYEGVGAPGWGITVNSASKLYLYQSTSSGCAKLTLGTALTTNAWHHIAYVGDIVGGKARLRLCVDGAVAGTLSSNATAFVDNTADLFMGATAGPTYRYFKGALDDVRFYDEVLSDADIAALAVPEPATLCLLGLGALALLRKRS
jgi:hypothetical protein